MRTVFFVALALAACWALVHPEFFYIHDFLHVARIVEMARGLQSGQFPVIWSAHFGYGYGMPLFLFYAPLPFFIGALLYLVGIPALTAMQILFIIATVGTMMTGYLVCRELWGTDAGLVGAALLTLAPYRALNIFVRGALSETWGFMAALLAVWGTVLVVRRKKWGYLPLWLGLSTLFLSHNISALIFFPFITIFFIGLVLIQKSTLKEKTNVLLSWGLSVLAAGGTAAFYVVPAFLEKEATHIDTILTGYFDYRLHFVYLRQFITPFWGYGGSSWGVTDDISFFLGYPYLLLFVSAVGVVSYLFIKRKNAAEQTVLGLLTLLCFLTLTALFMATGHSQPVWNTVSILATVQFPWRFLGPASLFLSLLVGAVFTWIPAEKKRQVSFVVVAGIIALQWQYFQPQHFAGVKDAYFYTEEERIEREASSVLPDYIPKTFHLPPPAVYAPIVCNPTEACSLIKLERSSAQWNLESTVAQETQVRLGIADFAGWSVSEDGRTIPHSTTSEGLIQFGLSAGNHSYRIAFASTPVRTQTRIISVCCAGAVLIYTLWLSRRKNT